MNFTPSVISFVYLLVNQLRFQVRTMDNHWPQKLTMSTSCSVELTRNAAMRRNQVFNNATKYWYDRKKKMKDGCEEKKMPLFWLHWLHSPSLVSICQSKLKLLSRNWISIFSNSDLDLDHRHLGSNPKLPLDLATHTASLVTIGQSKLKLLSRNLISTPFRICPPAIHQSNNQDFRWKPGLKWAILTIVHS